MTDQFKGLQVLELASVLAGPGVGQFFAELGADVLKVENKKTAGDVTRSWKIAGEKTDDRSAYFCCVNWGKQSIAIDLTSHEGREIVQALASKSDIVIASYKPGDAEKLGVDYEALTKLHPGLIYGQITGYGSDNANVGYDAIIQAEAGFMFMNGEPGGASLKMPVALMDVLAGHHLKEALLLAIIQKMRTGAGQLVEVSLIQAAVASLANQATNFLMAHQLPGKAGSAHPNIAPYGDVFITNDGKELLLAVGNDRQFRDLCLLLELNNLPNDERFSTNIARVQHRVELNRTLASVIQKHNSLTLAKRLNTHKIPGGLIQNLQQVFSMEEVKEMLLEHGDLIGVRSFAAAQLEIAAHFLPPPHLGQHTRPVLEQRLGYPTKVIEKLFFDGVVG